MKRIETSKKVLGSVLTFCMAGIAGSMVGWFMGLPEAPAMAGIFAGLAGSVIGWYIWKAKAENIIKYGEKHPYKKEENTNEY